MRVVDPEALHDSSLMGMHLPSSARGIRKVSDHHTEYLSGTNKSLDFRASIGAVKQPNRSMDQYPRVFIIESAFTIRVHKPTLASG